MSAVSELCLNSEVCEYLEQRVRAALDAGEDSVQHAHEKLNRLLCCNAAGIPRWNIVLDPGIGFAKNDEQNVRACSRVLSLHPRVARLQIALATGIARSCPERMPTLAGPSRKGFLGRLLDKGT